MCNRPAIIIKKTFSAMHVASLVWEDGYITFFDQFASREALLAEIESALEDSGRAEHAAH